MGILARFTPGDKSQGNDTNQSSLAAGGHAINKSKVLAATDPTVINPMNAGTWETIRTAPVNNTPRYFTKVEADALREKATETTQEARQSKRAYKSLTKIEQADAQVHKAHRGYIRGVADSELTKKRADAATAKHLHAVRPEYARLGFGLDRAENNAQKRIEELKAKIQDKY